ncbi:MAG TPA: DNA polymerase III subunit gamma/tau [Thermodesulfovibrionales bacterium]|nr:DNA polymerase III subunit gamma/tau [Thermodesulfovibrionales bacterium]
MSYLVLARKWRPLGFDDLIGQEAISRILSNAIVQGKIAHAYLFSGPRGVGKTTTARILAKAMNCEKGPTVKPCGVCASCKGIADGSSVDVMEIDGASNNSVDDIRDLRERVKYASAGGRYKVYIIDEAHMLSGPAFNALLKTLEEPPPHVVFVLATTAAGKVPATVLSRCQHLPFRRIPSQKIRERLKMISDSEGIRISGAAIELVARAAEGSMRDSLTILDQLSAFSSDINESEVKDLLGIADFRALSELASAVIRGDREMILGIISELADRGSDIKSFTKDLMNFFRDLLVAKVVSKHKAILDVSDNELAVIREILGTTTEDHLTLLLSEMINAESDVRVAFSPRIALEMSLIRASFLNMMKPVKEALEHIQSFGEEGGGHPKSTKDSGKRKTVNEQKEVVSPPASVDMAPPPDVRAPFPGPSGKAAVDFKGPFLQKVDAMNHPLACKLSGTEFSVEGDTVTITFNGGSAIHADSVKNSLELLETAASEILNRSMSLTIDIARKKVPRKKELKEKTMSEPLVKDAIELFEGRIVDVRQIENSEEGGADV